MATAPNDEWMENPIFAGRVPTLPSTYSAPRVEPKKRKTVPPVIGRIIGELGLRYRPALAADLEAHAEALRLLSEDVADVPPHLLEDAAKRWVRDNRFMPKASELIALAKGRLSSDIKGTDFGVQQLQAHCDRLFEISKGRQRWEIVGEEPNRTIAPVGR